MKGQTLTTKQPVQDRVQSLLDRLVTSGAATAAVAGRVANGEPELLGAAQALDTPKALGTAQTQSLTVDAQTRFDLASLSKPFTATLALHLDAAGEVPLELELGELWPETAPALAGRCLEDLLRHRSGLAPWLPLYHLTSNREEAQTEILSGRWLHGKGDGKAVYSDLGYILWGFAAERRTGRPLAELMAEHLTGPWELETIRPLGSWLPKGVVLSPMDTAKEVKLARQLGLSVTLQPPPGDGRSGAGREGRLVQDGNSRFLSGLASRGAVTGHAGLFGSLEAVLVFGRGWLQGVLGDPSGPLPKELAHRAVRAIDPDAPEDWALGWARQDSGGVPDPSLFAGAFGHPGFTGTSLWIDPEYRQAYALLATRTSPLEPFIHWRKEFHRLLREPGYF